MTITQMLGQSLILTGLGMGVVFSFLIIMICCMSLSSKVIKALKLDKEEVMCVLDKIIDKKLNVTQTEELIADILNDKSAPKRQTKRMFSDVKIFLNTINSAVDTMKKSGIGADIRREDTGESYIYRIEIPKKLVYKLPDKQTSVRVATLQSSDSI